MAIDLTLLEETPDVTTAETTTSGKRRFVFLRNSKSLTGFVIIAFFTFLAIFGTVARAVRAGRTERRPAAGSVRPRTGWAPTSSGRTSCPRSSSAPAAS